MYAKVFASRLRYPSTVPPSRYAIAVHIDHAFAKKLSGRSLAALARRVLRAEAVAAPAALSIAVVGDETVRELNQRYRGRDEPADVLSFSLRAGERFGDPKDDQLGEIVISYPMAARQTAAGHSIEDELAHLLTHGILHLLGYDHESPAEAKVMRAREEALLGCEVH
jgi:probable rRNA maturation factor